MGTRYDHLSLTERIEIFRLRADGRSLQEIGEAIGRPRSTVWRELKRNARDTNVWRGGYEPERAHGLALRRRRWDARFKLERQPELREAVRDRLAMGWSPQQIAGRLAHEQAHIRISHESIYRYIYHRSTQKDPSWHRLLPHRKFRRGRLRRGGISPVLHIKHRIPIAQRPPEVATRAEPGHWEADLMLFAKYGQAVLVAHERTSRILIATRQPSKAAAPVAARLKALLGRLPRQLRRSITFDNGTEFALHHTLHAAIGVETYFCDPHAPWQKGGVENAICRLRRRLPRKTDLARITLAHLDRMLALYNATPRRCLGYQTPAEAFWKTLTLLHFNRETTSPPARG